MPELGPEADLDPDLSNRLCQEAEAIRRWVYAVAVIQFDVDRGPVVECVYPEDALSDHLRFTISMTSIPDTANADIQDRHFILRLAQEDLLGIVCFRQIPDESQSRGFFQKSLIILTKLPLTELWRSIISVLAPIYFELGVVSVIEAAAHNWSEWPDPLSAQGFIHLPFLGQVVSVNIERAMRIQGSILYGLHTQIQLYDTFKNCLHLLWSLWELVIQGAPLLVIADSPTTSTNIVLGLISLMSPSFLYHADYRPYFTLSDPDYRAYLTMCNHNILPGCILGATSKYFLESLADFPNILKMDEVTGMAVLKMERKARIKCDHSFLKSLECHSEKNAELRRYFAELTSTFMASFDPMFKPVPYVARHSNSQIFNPFLDHPKLADFSTEQFLKNLLSSKLALAPLRRYISSRERISSLMVSIIEGPNFLPWFDYQRKSVSFDIDARMDAAIIAADTDEIVEGLSRTEVESMLKEIKRRRNCPRTKTRPALQNALDQHYEIVKDVISRLSYSHM